MKKTYAQAYAENSLNVFIAMTLKTAATFHESVGKTLEQQYGFLLPISCYNALDFRHGRSSQFCKGSGNRDVTFYHALVEWEKFFLKLVRRHQQKSFHTRSLTVAFDVPLPSSFKQEQGRRELPCLSVAKCRLRS